MNITQYFNANLNDSNLDNITILNRVRLIAIFGQSLLIIIAVGYLKTSLPLLWLASLIVIEIAFEIYSYLRVKSQRKTSSIELYLHLVFDSLILAGLIYCSGGTNNPFIYLLLLSVAFGSFMLSPGYLFLITLQQLSIYSLLHLFHNPIELLDSSPLASFHLHLIGMWVNFILTTILIAVFGLLARFSMLKQEKRIQALREKNLQDEQILGLGIMAANAAHELSTPLSTMAIIVEDIQHETINGVTDEDVHLLSKQIANCKRIIDVLGDKSKNAQLQLSKQEFSKQTYLATELATPIFVERFQEVIDAWLVYRPQIKLIFEADDNLQLIKQNISMSVEQAITNILDNAADASLENNKDTINVRLNLFDATALKQSIHIDIVDLGSGIALELSQSLGEQIQKTSKLSGLGWGVFLSNVSIERVGGRVEVIAQEEGGTLTRITLPLESKKG